MKLFLDANVLFTAAHNLSGKAAFIIELAREGHWEVVSSGYAIEEARRNLEAKFPDAVGALDAVLEGIGVVATVLDVACPIALPGKDEPIFLSSVAAGCTHLLTGDLKDFGPFMNAPERTSGVTIQTVAEFLSIAGG